MAGAEQHAEKFVRFINQQLGILKEESRTMTTVADHFIAQVQSKVDDWANGEQPEHVAFEEITTRIQQAITFFISKSVELTALLEKKEDFSQAIPKRLAALERAVASIETTAEQMHGYQGDVRKEMIAISTQQENNIKMIETLNKEIESNRKSHDTLKALEQNVHKNNSNIEGLIGDVKNVNKCFVKLEEQNISDNMIMDDIVKKVRDIGIKNDKISSKLNQMEVSINLMSSQYTEQLENMRSLNNDKLEDMFGMVCQTLAKSIIPREEIREHLIARKETAQKVFIMEDQVETVKAKMHIMESKMVSLEGQLRAVEVSFDCSDCHVANIESRVSTVEIQVATVESKLATVGNQVVTMERQAATFESQVATMGSQVATVESKVATAGNQVADIVRHVSTMESKVTSMRSLVATAESHGAVMNEDVDTTENQTTFMKSKTVSLDSQSSSIEGRGENIYYHDDSNDSHENIIEYYDEFAEYLGENTNDEVCSVRSNEDEINNPLDAIMMKLDALDYEVNTIENRIDEMKRHEGTLEGQIETVQIQTDTLESQINMISLRENAIENQMDTIERNKGVLERQIDGLRNQAEASGMEIDFLRCKTKFMLIETRTTQSQVAEILKDVSEIKTNCNQQHVGFFAFKTLNLSPVCEDVTMFDAVDNYGSHFDPTTGQFTAPLTGLYLISVSASTRSSELFSIRCFQKKKEHSLQCDDHRYLCAVYENRSLARCVEMTTGEVIYLRSVTRETTPNSLIVIQFSCCMIKG